MHADQKRAFASSMYERAIQGLKLSILDQFGSIRKFVSAFPDDPIGYENLSRIFSPNKPQEMSVGLYLRCLARLGLVSADLTFAEQYEIQLSLRSYLLLDNNAVLTSAAFLALKS